MATNTWNGSTAKWSVAGDWSNGLPAASDDVSITSGTVLLDTTTGATTVNSITVANNASLNIKDPGHTVSISGNFTVNGGATVDSTAFDPGGTLVTIAGTLTVTNSGAGFAVGNYLQGSDGSNPQPHGTASTTTVTAGAVSNTGGTINIQSYDALGSKAILNIAGAAGFGGQAGHLTGNVNIGSDGLHAGYQGLLEFASGQITTIDTASQLALTGAHAFVADAGNLTSSSALTGLATINGGLVMQAGSVVSITAGLDITSNGAVQVDTEFLGTAGSHLTVGGALTVDGSITVGRQAMTGDATVNANAIAGAGTITLNGQTGGTPYTGKLIVASAAGMGTTGHITSNITVQNQSLLQFASGQITTIDYPATVLIDGPHAFIADSGSITSNSALTGLTSVKGFFTLDDGASLTTSAGVAIGDVNTFHFTAMNVDNSGNGGSALTIGGTLTFNSGSGMTIGNDGITSNTALNASSR